VQFLRQWRTDTDQAAAIRVLEADAVGMQEQTPKSEVLQLAVELLVPVLAIAGYRVPCVGRVHADLVRPAGEQAHLEQGRKVAEELHRAELADRLLAAGIHLHRAFAANAGIGAKRRIDALPAQFPLAPHQREVALVETLALACTVLAQQGVQAAQHGALARDQQTAAGVPVEAMHQFQRLIGPRRAQRFDHASADAAATMHGDAGRLVDHQQTLVLMQNCALHLFRKPRRHARRGGGAFDRLHFQAHRRNTQHVALGQTRFAADALAIHAHFSATQQAEDPGAWHAGQQSRQHLVHAHSGVFGADHFIAHRCVCG